MMNKVLWWSAVAWSVWAVAGCGEDASDNSGTDTGSDVADSAVDTGTDVVDTGTDVVDTADSAVDTGTDVVDTADSAVDTGTDVVDTADSVVDTGTDVVDTADSAGDTGTDSAADLFVEIAGTYEDPWGGHHVIEDTAWTASFPDGSGGVYSSTTTVVYVDNDADYLVGRNEDDTWSRYDWTVVDGALYYCQIAFAAATQEEAMAATDADRSDLEGGCGGFGWSALTPVL